MELFKQELDVSNQEALAKEMLAEIQAEYPEALEQVRVMDLNAKLKLIRKLQKEFAKKGQTKSITIPRIVPTQEEIERSTTSEELGQIINSLISLKEVLSYMKDRPYPWQFEEAYMFEVQGPTSVADNIGRQLHNEVLRVLPATLQGAEDVNRVFGQFIEGHSKNQRAALKEIMRAIGDQSNNIRVSLDFMLPENLINRLCPNGVPE